MPRLHLRDAEGGKLKGCCPAVGSGEVVQLNSRRTGSVGRLVVAATLCLSYILPALEF